MSARPESQLVLALRAAGADDASLDVTGRAGGDTLPVRAGGRLPFTAPPTCFNISSARRLTQAASRENVHSPPGLHPSPYNPVSPQGSCADRSDHV